METSVEKPIRESIFNKVLNFTNVKNSELIDIKYERTEYIQKVAKKMYQFEEVSELFYDTYLAYNNMINTNNDDPINLLLYGPGGYGKSYGTLVALKEMGLKGAIIECGSSTTLNDIFSGVNIKVLQEEGIKQFNFPISPLFNNEYDVVIFEEGLSMPSKTLTDLRTLLTQKYYNLNNEKYYLTTKFLIMLTNVSPDILVQNTDMQSKDSIKAIAYERFPKQIRVIWKSHEPNDYYELLKIKFKINSRNEELKAKTFAELICEINSNTGNNISPRTAGLTYHYYYTSGIKGLKNVIGIDQEQLENILSQESDRELRTINSMKLDEIKKYIMFNTGEKKQIVIYLEALFNILDKLKLDPSNHDIRLGLLKNIKDRIDNIKKEILNDMIKNENLNDVIKDKLTELKKSIE